MNVFWTLLFLGLGGFSCSNKNAPVSSSIINQSQPINRDLVFEVYKIDSINSFYLIYAKRANSIYKIVSRKNENGNCDELKLNQRYYLTLNSIWTKPIMIGDVNVSPSQTPHVTGMHLDDSTIIKIDREKGIYDLFTTVNIQGLCYLNNK